MDEALDPNSTLKNRAALSVLEEEVSVPPHSSVLVTVTGGTAENISGIVEVNMQLLLDRRIAIARASPSSGIDKAPCR